MTMLWLLIITINVIGPLSGAVEGGILSGGIAGGFIGAFLGLVLSLVNIAGLIKLRSMARRWRLHRKSLGLSASKATRSDACLDVLAIGWPFILGPMTFFAVKPAIDLCLGR
jgi:hypothetical protein